MKRVLFILVLLIITSCNYFDFESKKIKEVKDDSHELVQQRLKELDKTKIDRYPVFLFCESLQNNIEEEKDCFLKTLSTKIHDQITKDTLVVKQQLSETIKVYIEISKTGETILHNTEISDSLKVKLPTIEQSIIESLNHLPEIKPAIKYLPSKNKDEKGEAIPVSTHFVIPIRITGE